MKELNVLIVSCIILLPGCKNSIYVPNGDDLNNPSVTPMVVAMSPKPYSVGPYLGPGYTPPGMIRIVFNKSMISDSVIKAVSLYDVQERYSVDSSRSWPQQNNSVFDFVFRNAANRILTHWKVGKTYEVRISTSAVDINGLHPALPFKGMFTPEPYFRVTVSPYFNLPIDQLQFSNYRVEFNSPIDPSILSYLTAAPEPLGNWKLECTQDGCYSIKMENAIPKFAQTYTITMDRNAHDVYNNHLNESYKDSFTITTFGIRSTYPSGGEQAVELGSSIIIVPTGLLDTTTVLRSFSISPQIDGNLYTFGVPPHIIEFAPLKGFKQNTNYQVALDQALKASDGTPLPARFSFSFHTDYFKVRYSTPYDQETNVYVDAQSPIRIELTGGIDTSSVRNSISIAPTTSGTVTYADRETVLFYPNSALISGSDYTVSVRATLRSLAGDTLILPYQFSFRTHELVNSRL